MSTSWRVCIFMGRFAVGGTETFTNELSDILARLGHSVEVVAGLPEKGEAMAHGTPVLLKHMRRSVHPFSDLLLFAEFMRYLRSARPDVLITQTSKAGIVGRVVGRLLGTRAIIHFYQGHVMRDFFSPVASSLVRLFERAAGLLCDAVVLPRERDVEIFANEMRIVPRKKCFVVRAPLDLQAISPLPREGAPQSEARARFRAAHHAGDDTRIVGMLSRLSPVKNVSLGIRAFAALVARTPHQKLRLFVAGDGPEEGVLKALVKDLGVESLVSFLGTIRALDDFYCGIDLFLHTSLHEGHGIVVLNALVNGAPAVCTPEGIIVDNPSPFVRIVSKEASAEEWAEVMAGALQLGRADEKTLAASRKRLEERYNSQSALQDTQALLALLMEGTRKS